MLSDGLAMQEMICMKMRVRKKMKEGKKEEKMTF